MITATNQSGARALVGAALLAVLLLAACASPETGRTQKKWQVVRDPGTTSCAAVPLVYAGDFGHREQIGVYGTPDLAEAALARFKTTKDTMTASGRMICQ
jgi:hypothetical protein